MSYFVDKDKWAFLKCYERINLFNGEVIYGDVTIIKNKKLDEIKRGRLNHQGPKYIDGFAFIQRECPYKEMYKNKHLNLLRPTKIRLRKIMTIDELSRIKRKISNDINFLMLHRIPLKMDIPPVNKIFWQGYKIDNV